jgi:NAD(P)-dependent dehydrogenase (short-subunit alcohol dehydrogenase family)
MGRLDGKAAIITGAGRGIGKGIAQAFLSEGARLIANDLVVERLEASAQELRALGEVHTLAGDVSDSRFCQQLVASTKERLGRLDVLVNNAGIAVFEPFLEATDGAWDRTMAVNLKALFRLGQEAARLMVAQGEGGVILNMASANGHVAERSLAAYNTSKGGVVMLTRSMAVDLAEHNIRVNCVSPGYIGPMAGARDGGATAEFIAELPEHVPLGRFGTVAEVGALYAFLASDEASFITGESVVIDGGQLALQR